MKRYVFMFGALSLACSSVFAATGSPPTAAVPAMSSPALVVLAVAVTALGARYFRSRK
ncbi:MAG: hypothetical protein KDG50_12990 [Chromatiales bacterium]|nr:hypothetical protein [Chromatiales bacterium]